MGEWRPDPTGKSRLQWFDGQQWTAQYAPMPVNPDAAPQSDVRRYLLIGVPIAVVLAVILGFGAKLESHGRTKAPDSDCATVAGSSEKYLCWLRSYGFTVTDETQQSLMVAGSTLCSGLRGGGTPDEGIAVLYRTIPDMTEKQAGLLISAAQFGLCPDTL